MRGTLVHTCTLHRTPWHFYQVGTTEQVQSPGPAGAGAVALAPAWDLHSKAFLFLSPSC